MPFRNMFRFWGHKTHPKTTWHCSELHTSNGEHKNSHVTGSNSHVTLMTSASDTSSSTKRNVTTSAAVAGTVAAERSNRQSPGLFHESGVVDDHVIVPKTEQPLRYCDDDDDLGIMSEVETSCTSGKTARRNGRHKAPSSPANAATSNAISTSMSASNIPEDSDKNAINPREAYSRQQGVTHFREIGNISN
ncbi:unnamed protein product [Soboliphyme baturini]|uniref:Uncharacterized protein n=1 Tax=Soboliphyme baturini TaxID=241478 RepID=A0A183IZB0_9BILA|nr:unnamed protein product [Soboliphyme baturini]